MRLNDFDIYKDLLQEKSGLHLTQDKCYLLDSRLTPVAKKWGFHNIDILTMSLRGVPEPGLIKDVVEAMTEADTAFFRDGAPFDLFENTVLPDLLKTRAKKKKFRVWSAGCSTGQEPYSIAMILKEHESDLSGWTADVMASDISTSALTVAERGEYEQFEVQRGLPVRRLLRHFEQKNDKWALKASVKVLIKFRYYNLMDSVESLGWVDVVFCRNVLGSFDPQTRARILSRLAALIPEDGWLFLGHDETPDLKAEGLSPVPDVPGAYRRTGKTSKGAGKPLAS